MASYATIVSTPAPPPVTTNSTVASPSYHRGTLTEVQQNITAILTLLQGVTTTPESLIASVNTLRADMESIQPTQPQGMRTAAPSRFGNTQFTKPGSQGQPQGQRTQGQSQSQSQGSQETRSFQSNWRSGQGQGQGHNQGHGHGQQQSQHQSQGRFTSAKTNAFDTRSPTTQPTKSNLRYQSKFKTEGDINDKILNTVIGNKLNSFTKLTYNDTRDFIYQIMDSGETEFIKDFIEKVFSKATVEELYCALFAKLIAEIAHRYPIMYEEMKRYHSEFLKVFEDVNETGSSDSNTMAKKRQYRLGYGQFISELAGQNALEKEQLLAMVTKVMDTIWELSSQEGKINAVEECVDCLVRLNKSLVEKSPKFFNEVKGEMGLRIIERVTALVTKKAGDRPSLTPKARFGLMDLKDIL
jgi:hypothetical protein